MIEPLSTRDIIDLNNPIYKQLKEENSQYAKELAGDMRELFLDSDLGLRVLKHLMDITVDKPAVSVNSSERADMWSGGRNDIVWYILTLCKTSDRGDK
ncbi:MAG: hypothetical protein KAR06_03825 [Deltaproteobacteria bacterium]|nr:hypothetical protein [Deltaproteobacteria bacterium]